MWGLLYLQLHVGPLSFHVGDYVYWSKVSQESFVPSEVLEVPSLLSETVAVTLRQIPCSILSLAVDSLDSEN